MHPGGKSALLLSCMALVGCATTTSRVKIKAVSNPAEALSGSFEEIGLARAQLALGNVGVALEAFRKAHRDNPADVVPLAGIGDCYAAMGRFDIAQSSYEAALALSPHDPSLLLNLAVIFDREGKPDFAMAARAEASVAAETAKPPLKATATVSAVTPAAATRPVFKPVAAVGSITVDLPPARPADHALTPKVQPSAKVLNKVEAPAAISANAVEKGRSPEPALPAPKVSAPVALSSSITVALPAPPSPIQPDSATAETKARTSSPAPAIAHSTVASLAQPAPAVPPTSSPAPAIGHRPVASLVQPAEAARPTSKKAAAVAVSPAALTQPSQPVVAEPARSLAVQSTLPTPGKVPLTALPRPKLLAESLLATDDKLVASEPAPVQPAPVPNHAPVAQAALAPAGGPRLERLSSGEVALITTGKSIWRAPDNVQTASVEPRWVALAQTSRPNIQLLNAARSQGLAASARTVLSGRGWRKIAIGDASEIREKSVVLYPKGRESLGRRLAAQFGVSARLSQRDDVVLLLGRDVADKIGG